MTLTTIIIGDEILLGRVADTNSGAVARMFEPEGWTVKSVLTVGDSERDIRTAVETALAQSDLVIMTGGLGPTKDDITKAVLAEVFGGPLRMDPSVTENIHEVFNRRGLKMNELTELQAMVPASCRVIQNKLGTAPIMWFERDGRVLVAMPGVPFETVGMLPEVHRQVRAHFAPSEVVMHHSFNTVGITESALAEKLAGFEASLPQGMHLAYLPNPGYIRLRLDAHGSESEDIAPAFQAAVEALRRLIVDNLSYEGEATLAEELLRRLISKNLTISTAESCTGGAVAAAITAVPGASEAMLGGVVSYSNSVKTNLLGVPEDTLQAVGAVSSDVVMDMAYGVSQATKSNCSIATSGIAGPGGGTPQKPVGTVWMAWNVNGGVMSRCFHFPGDRKRVIERAVNEALLGLIKLI